MNTKLSTRTPESLLVAVLAAGRALRFGGGKLEAACAGRPLGRWALDAVARAGLSPGVIVTGPAGVGFAPEWTALVNSDPAAGLGSSLALAARHALEQGSARMLVLLADMPLVTPDHLRLLASSHSAAATRHSDGHAGVPALLDQALLEAAAELSGERGAGRLLGDAQLIDAPPGSLADVDTPGQLMVIDRVLLERSG